MASTLLTMLSNKPGASTLTLVSGTTDTGYGLLLDETNFGDAVWDVQFSGQRGTQGARAASSTPQNRPLVLSLEVAGTSRDNLASRLSTLYATVDEFRRFGGKVTFRAEGQTYRQHFDVMAGAAQAKSWDRAAEFGQMVNVVCSFQCAPYLLGDPMEITDTFSTDTLADYTFGAGAASNVAVTGGVLDAVNNLTTENRAVHTAYGYDYGDNQVTLKFTPGSTITSFKAGVVFKRIDASNFLEVYVDDNGTNSRLRLDKMVAGVRTNLASNNLAARVIDGTAGWVRARIEGNNVYQEYFTVSPGPTDTPTLAPTTYTLAGAEATAFGTAVTGKSGWSWIPQQTAATLDDFSIVPYTYRNRTLPDKWSLYGAIPGDAPALADVSVITDATTAIPFGLISWSPRTSLNSATTAFGFFEGESASLGSWASAVNAGARGGNAAKITTAGAGTAVASFGVDPSALLPEDHTTGDLGVEVWARFEIPSTLVSPRITASAFVSSTNLPGTRYTAEWGSVGKLLTVPSSGTRWRFVRLGTLPLYVDRTTTLTTWVIQVAATWAAGSTGDFSLDYMLLVPAKGRALSPTSKANDSSYPTFLRVAAGQAEKRIAADLSGKVGSGVYYVTTPSLFPDNGLGGSPIELSPGSWDMVVKLSTLVPDNPTADATTETLSHASTVKVSPTPRYHFLRT